MNKWRVLWSGSGKIIAAWALWGLLAGNLLGQAPLAKTFRGASTAATGPLGPARPLPVGSLGKPIIAMGILQLARQGRIDLDAPVTKYLATEHCPDNPYADTAPLTTAHLLEHSSGLDDTHFSEYIYPADLPSAQRDFRPWLARSSALHCRWPPGHAPAYSNLNYVLLALVIESASGQAWTDYLADSVVRPLGMEQSYFPGPGAPEAHPAVADFIYTPAYSFHSTVPDLLELVHCWERQGAPVLDSVGFARMLRMETTRAARQGLHIGYTAGLQKDFRDGQVVYWMTGSVPGWTSRLEWWPASTGGWAGIYQDFRGYDSGDAPASLKLRAEVVQAQSKTLAAVPPPFRGDFDSDFVGCYARANPRNAVLGGYDARTQIIEMEPMDGDILPLDGQEYVRRGAGRLSGLLDTVVTAVYGVDGEGERFVQVGNGYFTECSCRRADWFWALRHYGRWHSLAWLLLGVVMWWRGKGTWPWSFRIAVTGLGFWGVEMALGLFQQGEVMDWTAAGGAGILIALGTGLPLLVGVWNGGWLVRSIRKSAPGWAQFGLALGLGGNISLAILLLTQDLLLFVPWRW